MSYIKHENRAHALLSPSGASRWMNCTPSARREEHIAEKPSEYAREGTLAHELGEIELRKHFGLITIGEYNSKLVEIEADEMYSEEMPEEVSKYVDYIIEQHEFYKPQAKWIEVSVEDKIDLTDYIENGFGSNDFVGVFDHLVEVVDLKYGRGVSVSAVDNPQLKLYALGALKKHELMYDIKQVKLTIIQPRINSISSFVMDADELKRWGEEEVKPKATIAYSGEGELKAGEWCKFCKFKPKCKAIFDENLKMIEEDFGDPFQISEDELLKVYNRKEQIVSWLNSIDAYVLSKLLKKEPIPGYKLVEGRSTRKFADETKVVEILKENGYEDEKFMSKPKLLGIGAVEKLLGKKDFPVILDGLVVKEKGKPTVALENDKRGSFFTSAEDDFNDDNDSLV